MTGTTTAEKGVMPMTNLAAPEIGTPKRKVRGTSSGKARPVYASGRARPESSAAPAAAWPIPDAVCRYRVDAWQRGVLFLDALRERANNMLEHDQAGMPPLLDFEHETDLDARTFDPPANYALLRITAVGKECLEDCLGETKPPVMIVDPRAGRLGGAWLANFVADLGDGQFDGAWLVENFENLKPGNGIWDKYAKHPLEIGGTT